MIKYKQKMNEVYKTMLGIVLVLILFLVFITITSISETQKAEQVCESKGLFFNSWDRHSSQNFYCVDSQNRVYLYGIKK